MEDIKSSNRVTMAKRLFIRLRANWINPRNPMDGIPETRMRLCLVAMANLHPGTGEGDSFFCGAVSPACRHAEPGSATTTDYDGHVIVAGSGSFPLINSRLRAPECAIDEEVEVVNAGQEPGPGTDRAQTLVLIVMNLE